jgi:hypothetical protein
MTVRPNINEETVEEVNEKLRDVMRVDPETVGLDEKIRVLLHELEELTEEVEESDNESQRMKRIENMLTKVERAVDNPNRGR